MKNFVYLEEVRGQLNRNEIKWFDNEWTRESVKVDFDKLFDYISYQEKLIKEYEDTIITLTSKITESDI